MKSDINGLQRVKVAIKSVDYRIGLKNEAARAPGWGVIVF